MKIIACVASVSVRLSARSMHFSLFWPWENWGRRKPPLPLPAASISVALAPIFAQPKSEKRLQRAESPTETLATQAMKISKASATAVLHSRSRRITEIIKLGNKRSCSSVVDG